MAISASADAQKWQVIIIFFLVGNFSTEALVFCIVQLVSLLYEWPVIVEGDVQ